MKKTMKTISILALALVLMLGMTVTSFADTKSNVDFVDHAEDFIFEPESENHPKDLFPDFKGVMPGDTLTQIIEIRNTHKTDYINVYMKALGVHQGDGAEKAAEYDAFLSQLELTVKAVGGDTELFNAKANETAQLTEAVRLVELMPAQTYMTLEVSLHVPIELDDTYQRYLGKLDWRFQVDQFEYEEIHTDDENDQFHESTGEGGSDQASGDSDKNKDKGTQTGDDSNMMPVMLVGLLALIAMIVALLAKRKKAEEE